ncbi:MAG: hypothetical protein EOP48_17205 [Sphingobacteriales bacterium]|nr:MAG: hypothetical protein EOP48_17205 [Sphingobacteriales bacterium]
MNYLTLKRNFFALFKPNEGIITWDMAIDSFIVAPLLLNKLMGILTSGFSDEFKQLKHKPVCPHCGHDLNH